jgi:hypothetical protein
MKETELDAVGAWQAIFQRLDMSNRQSSLAQRSGNIHSSVGKT